MKIFKTNHVVTVKLITLLAVGALAGCKDRNLEDKYQQSINNVKVMEAENSKLKAEIESSKKSLLESQKELNDLKEKIKSEIKKLGEVKSAAINARQLIASGSSANQIKIATASLTSMVAGNALSSDLPEVYRAIQNECEPITTLNAGLAFVEQKANKIRGEADDYNRVATGTRNLTFLKSSTDDAQANAFDQEANSLRKEADQLLRDEQQRFASSVNIRLSKVSNIIDTFSASLLRNRNL